jgi:hypothetical protein
VAYAPASLAQTRARTLGRVFGILMVTSEIDLDFMKSVLSYMSFLTTDLGRGLFFILCAREPRAPAPGHFGSQGRKGGKPTFPGTGSHDSRRQNV